MASVSSRGMAPRDALGEGHTIDQFHDQIVGPHVEERADVGMIQCCYCPGLALKTLAELFRGKLDRHVAAKPAVRCTVHFAHAAGTNLGRDAVISDNLAYHFDSSFERVMYPSP